MNSAIEIIWAVGLAGVLIPTLVVLKQVALIHRELSHIYKLSQIALEAAKGIRANLAPLSELGALAPPAVAIKDSTASIAATSRTLIGRLPFKG